jgi:integrase
LVRLFKEAALDFLKAKDADGRVVDKGRKQQEAQLAAYAFPSLGGLQVQSIDADRIADCLRPIWTTKPVTAKKVRSLIIRTLRYARPDGALFVGTLGPAITDRLPAQPRQGNFDALPYEALPAFWERLAAKNGMGALALQATILTAARNGEVRGATWDEVDLDKAVWTIPASRMKMGRTHRVPLSPEALAVFEEAKKFQRPGSPYVFTGANGELSNMTLTKVLRDLKVDCTTHGFRSTFRDWAAEQISLPGEIAEAALAHAVPNAVEAAYRRTDFFDKRRDLMDAWGRFATGGESAKVVDLAARLELTK